MCHVRSTAQGHRQLESELFADPTCVMLAMSDTDVAGRLAEALAEAGLSQSDLARRLAGPDADRRRVDARRRLILKWLQRRHFPSPRYAQELGAIFNHPAEFFSSESTERNRERGVIAAADLDLLDYVQRAAAGAARATDGELRLPLEGEALMSLIPLFNPARILVDRIVKLDPGISLTAEATFGRGTWKLGYWYRGTDFVAGILQIEAMAQASAFMLVALPQNRHRIVLAGGYERVRFRRPVKLEEKLVITCRLKRSSGPISRVDVEARCAGEVVARAEAVLVVH